MAFAYTSKRLAVRQSGFPGGDIDDWSEIEAILASPKPLCGPLGSEDRPAGRDRLALLAMLAAVFCLAVLPLDSVGWDCGRNGGCSTGPSEERTASLAPPAPWTERVAASAPSAQPAERIARDLDGAADRRVTEGRSAADDVGSSGAAPTSAATTPSAPLPQHASLSPSDDAASTPNPGPKRHHRHRRKAHARASR